MNTKNFLIGGIVGGVVFFLLGYLFYGVLLTDFFREHPGTATNVDRPMDQFQWWALILGNLFFGLLLAYVFTKSGVATLTSGLITGAILGFLVSASIDLSIYATTNIASKQMVAADVATTTVIAAITGAVIGAVIGMLNRTRTVNNTQV
jgi:uncharacterized membrane protein